jgi:hypothetical protein
VRLAAPIPCGTLGQTFAEPPPKLGSEVTTFLKLLGPPSINLPDTSGERPPPGIKGLALLAHLTLEPGAHTRDELAALLWGESSEAAARGSLRQVLLLIRQNLGEVLRVDRHAVELVNPPECDVTAFLRTVEHDPAEAVKLEIPVPERLLASGCAGLRRLGGTEAA